MRALDRIPDDASYEEVIDTVFVVHKVLKGLQDGHHDHTIPPEEVEELLDSVIQYP